MDIYGEAVLQRLIGERLIGERVAERVSGRQKGHLRQELSPEESGNQHVTIEAGN
ncbi:MAG: hypothetical protein ACRDS9_25480 [Pseudonocardiaceae bacterium]